MKRLAIGLFIFGAILAACGTGQTASPTETPAPAAQAPPTAPPPTPTETAPAPASTEAAGPATEPTSGPTPVSDTNVAVSDSPANDVRTFVIVPEESQARYIVAEEFLGGALDRLGIQPGLTNTIGRTQEVEGEMELDFSRPVDPVVSSQFSVNLRSLTSDQPRRDQRIREANLESNKYPLATFTINSLENFPTSYTEGQEITFRANGDLTIRDITQPVTFDVTAKLQGDTITGMATTQLAMTDFGFDPPNFANLLSVANDLTAEVQFTFKQQS